MSSRRRNTDRITPRLKFDKRVVVARITQVGADYCNLALGDDRRGRLEKEHADSSLKARWSSLKEGESFKVFLARPSLRDPGCWHVNQLWARPKTNPWISSLPKTRAILEGIVTRYVEDYAAIVETDNGIEAFLHRARVPGAGFTPINEILFVGDRVRGEVVRADTSTLQVEIDLKPVIQKAVADARAHRLALRDKEQSAPEPLLPPPDPVLADKRLWVVDDDAPLREAMTEWLTPSLDELRVFSGARDLRHALAQDRAPTHILIDRDLQHSDEWDACLAAINDHREQIAVAACSARRGLLEGISHPALTKPIDGAMLFQWLRGEEPTSEQHRIESSEDTARNPRWLDRVLEMDFRSEATAFLDLLCRDHDLSAAVWVEQSRPGFFEAIASSGIDSRALARVQPSFSHTLVGNTIDRQGDELSDRIGALADLLPNTPVVAFGLSLAGWGLEDHGVAFLAPDIPREKQQLLSHMGPALAALIRQREMAAHLQEVEPFAALGRFWSGYAHELRQSAATALIVARGIAHWLPQDASPLDSILVAPVRERVRELVRAVGQLQATVGYELGRVRRRAPQQVRVVQAVQNLISLVQAQLRHRVKEDGRDRPSGEPLVWLAGRPITDPEIHLDSQALDQPLMNLLDNALHQVRHRGDDGEIQIRVRVEPTDPDGLPLWVEVEDNGGRMTSIQRTRLFRPRTSTRGDEGIGLGLYVSKRLVEAVGGRLELVETETVRYLKTVFRLRLPYRIQGPDHG